MAEEKHFNIRLNKENLESLKAIANLTGTDLPDLIGIIIDNALNHIDSNSITNLAKTFDEEISSQSKALAISSTIIVDNDNFSLYANAQKSYILVPNHGDRVKAGDAILIRTPDVNNPKFLIRIISYISPKNNRNISTMSLWKPSEGLNNPKRQTQIDGVLTKEDLEKINLGEN